MFSPLPRTMPWLAPLESKIPVELSILCHPIQGYAERGTTHPMPIGQRIQVHKVAPSRVGGASGNRCCDFLGKHHFQRVATHPQNTIKQARQADVLGLRPNRVTYVYIDVKTNCGTR
jgi:hypothetical protein